MRRGEIRYADLEPHRGSEANERRPVVIVSNDGLNGAVRTLGRGVVTVVPLTSQTLKVHPFQVLLPSGDTGFRTTARHRPNRCAPSTLPGWGHRSAG
ncbi:MAG TPA: type II toxin-antitoxin system PemK/MazF family toxin [Phycicoccus elongatus]|nr:type II toxin-antitoxin system PemK/MazF family toxin [Phycicoccus elongatus]